MGCVNEKQGSKEEEVQSRKIDANLRKEKKAYLEEIKLLLLGSGESGKTTITKQMKIIHMSDFSEEERLGYVDAIHNNAVTSMLSIILAGKRLNIEISRENQGYAELFSSEQILATRPVLTPEVVIAIKELWKDEGVQEIYSKSSSFQLMDSAEYFIKNIERISAEGYIPDTKDLLRSRSRSSGISEITFDMGGSKWRMVDVGGQRNERKKWIHCFQEVTALIFCVASSEYDLKLYEDENVNRMHESLTLFDEICNSQWFVGTSVILFLNKIDLFKKKIKKIDLNVCFPEYSGGCNYETAITFIKDKFVGLKKNQGKTVYTHITCATDTENMKFVFNSVRDIIVRESLVGSNLL